MSVKISRRVLCFIMSIILISGVFLSAIVTVNADSAGSATQRVTNFIGMAAGKKIQDIDENLKLTKDELRFLGVYVSNFFIPFGTELGADSEDTTTQNKEDIVSALSNSLNFSEELSEMFVENIIGLSRSNNTELEFRVSKNYLKDFVAVPNIKVNYYNFFRLMLGQTRNVFEGYTTGNTVKENGKVVDKTPTVIKNILTSVSPDTKAEDRKYKYGYFGYEKDGEFVPMFDCSLVQNFANDKLTPSMIVFRQCLGSVDMNNGYGTSFFDFTKQEAEDTDDLSGMLKDLSEDNLYKMSVYGTSMSVDCFGNIIMKGANHQYIAVPGCLNPYTWVSTNEDGEDAYKAGSSYSMINFMSMGLADTGRLLKNYNNPSSLEVGKKDNGLKETYVAALMFDDEMVNSYEGIGAIEWGPKSGFIENIKTPGANSIFSSFFGKDSWVSKIFFNGGKNTMEKKIPLRVLRGSNEYNIGAKVFKFMDKAIKEQVVSAENGFKKANKGDYSYYAALYDEGLNASWYKFSLGYVSESVNCMSDPMGSEINGKTYLPNTKMKLIDNFVFIDNLGAFGFDNTANKIDYNAIKVDHYLDDSGISPKKLFESWGNDSNNGFSNMYKDIQSGKMNTKITADAPAIVGVYTTYALAGLYQDDASSRKATVGMLGFRMNKDAMVEISNEPLNLPESLLDAMVNDTIRNWIYYVLHPTKGLDYVRVLITNKVNSLLVGWHHDMVGTNGVGATTGTTLYRPNTGYVTTPDLSELQWTNKLIELYNQAIPFIIVIMIVTMLFAFITCIFSIQKSVFNVIIFTCFLMTPVTLINNVVGISNRVSQNIYGEKFTYWALVQQESYTSQIDEAASGDSYSNYLRTLYAANSKAYSNQGSDSIVLKWQAPKKMASLMLSSDDKSLLDSLQSSFLTQSILGSDSFSGESYLDGDNAYLYRSYTDLANFSRYIYDGIRKGNRRSRKSLGGGCISGLDNNMQKRLKQLSSGYEKDRKAGYTNLNYDGGNNSSSALHTALPLTSNMYVDAVKKKGKVAKLNIDDYVGINQDAFNFSIAMFNNMSLNFKETILANCSTGNENTLKRYLSKYQDQDLTGLAAYSLMSESPFYYFSWNLYDQGMSTGSSASGGYKKLLLNESNGGYFYNNKGNTELKDFMDMKTLFTYTIPYLKLGNDLVKEWDDVYGIFVYDGVSTEEGHADDPEIKADEELRQKYWHNLNVARLYEVYTPWVDLMYDCSYAQPETITVMGRRYVVADPIDPASYPSERPMIFSESEMHDYGLSSGDLTKVEKLILDCNKGMQERMFDLLNYYNFSDATLNTAAAMNCVFEFNTTFSQSTMFSGNINLYPQSYEISDFSYDAFLRFILANTLGIDMTSQDDFYTEIVKNSSTTTAIMMIVLDILSQYALPAFKIFFLVAVFLGAVLLIIATAFKVDPQQRFIPKLIGSLFLPMLYFLLTNIGFSWIVSLFMGSGSNAVTQTERVTISMGDPVVVMIAIAALDILLMVLYWKIVKKVIESIKSNFKSIAGFMGSVYGGMLSIVGGAVSGVGLSSASGSGGSASGVGGSVNSEEGDAQKGTGSVSPRAARRGNASSYMGTYEDNERINNTKRRTVENVRSKSSKSDAEKQEALNKKTKEGSKKIEVTSFGDSSDAESRDRVKEATRHQENKLE